MTAILCQHEQDPAAPFSGPLTVELFTGKEAPADLLERAGVLESGSPFGRAVWWRNWWRQMRPPGCELFLVSVSRGSELIGLAPWYTHRARGFGRVVRFLGDGRACSDYASIAALPGCRDDAWREITNWVITERGRSWDSFILSGVSAADDAMQAFCQRLSQHDILVDRRTIGNTWRLTLPDSWDAYLELLSKQHRNRARRMQRDMFDSGRAVFRRVSTPLEFERGFEIQRRLHQSRRQSLGDAGCFADTRFEMFLYDATREFLEQGDLRLQWTEVDGEPVAFDSGYVDHDTVFVYQTAIDPAKANLSPGRLHLQASIMAAIGEGYRCFDFLRGDESYKAHFRATPIPVYETRLVSARVLPRLRHGAWKLHKRLRDRLRATFKEKAATSD